MYSWNVLNPDLTGDNEEDIKILKQKIDEMNQAMRILVTQMRKQSKIEE